MYSRSKLDYSQFKNQENDLDQVQAKADELYSYTLEAIGDYRPQIAELKDVLMEQYVLSKDAIFALLAQQKLRITNTAAGTTVV
jgi:cell division protease FtsH